MPYKLKIDGVDQVLVFSTKTLLNTDAIAWQKVSGRLPADVVRGFQAGDAEAMTLVVWTCRRHAGEPDLKYGDVVFDLAKSDMEWEDEDGEGQADGEGEQGADPSSPESAPATLPSKKRRSSTSAGSRSS